jgi:NAD(P)-dependent dehydrogenase (short-subunit alcohol dehydrogenase family)
MKVCLADLNAAALDLAAAEVASHAASPAHVRALATDVSRREDVQRLKDAAYEAFGEVAFLMNNAGVEGGGALFGDAERWRRILDVNLWGVINGVQIFAPAMIAQNTPCAIVNTGSKQGITCPPGETAYNVTKAGVKVVTEALAHELRNIEGCATTAHLLVPGFTFTGLTKVRVQEKPAAAWTPEQVIDFMLVAMAAGDFYLLCPDNDVTRAMDERRILWAAEDIIKNRPALSRWHPDFKEAFAEFMKG